MGNDRITTPIYECRTSPKTCANPEKDLMQSFSPTQQRNNLIHTIRYIGNYKQIYIKNPHSGKKCIHHLENLSKLTSENEYVQKLSNQKITENVLL